VAAKIGQEKVAADTSGHQWNIAPQWSIAA
jgi:hypothetical protein